jgi:hypothetical protein
MERTCQPHSLNSLPMQSPLPPKGDVVTLDVDVGVVRHADAAVVAVVGALTAPLAKARWPPRTARRVPPLVAMATGAVVAVRAASGAVVAAVAVAAREATWRDALVATTTGAMGLAGGAFQCRLRAIRAYDFKLLTSDCCFGGTVTRTQSAGVPARATGAPLAMRARRTYPRFRMCIVALLHNDFFFVCEVTCSRPKFPSAMLPQHRNSQGVV